MSTQFYTKISYNIKNNQVNIYSILTFIIIILLISIAEIIAYFNNEDYNQLIFNFLRTLLVTLIPLVIFHNNLKLFGYIIIVTSIFVPISFFSALLYNKPLNFDIAMVILNTYPSEAYELTKGYIVYIVIFLVFYYSFIFYLVKKLPTKISFKISIYLSIISLFLLCILPFFKDSNKGYIGSLKIQLIANYYGSILYTFSLVNKSINLLNNHDIEVKNFKFNAKKTKTTPHQEVYVLIIGESSRVKNWGIFGYTRPTTPELKKKEKNLITFPNMVSGGYITNIAVPLLLSRATPDTYHTHYYEKSVISAYKEAGFKTYWLSNQTDLGDIKMYSKEADEEFFLPSNYTFGENVNMDLDLIPKLENVLNRKEKKVFIVLHTLGSHFDYNARYPESFDKFKPSLKQKKVSPTDYVKRQYLINSYDNSILYTDYLINKVIDLTQKLNTVSYVTYVSDHGEDMFDDDRKLSQHIHSVPSQYVASVPLIIWTSNQYNKTFPDKLHNLEVNKYKPIASENLFYTFLDMSGISYPGIDSSKSIASSKFIKGNQIILGGESKFYTYDELKYNPKKLTSKNGFVAWSGLSYKTASTCIN